jgi:hypothetical protein
MPPIQRRRNIRLLSYTVFVLLVCELGILPTSVLSQPKSQRTKRPSTATNAQIPKIVAEINPKNIENTIRKLVSFGTRNTLSQQDDPNRGIGAARDWLYAEFQKAAAWKDG